ncbi:MAG: hypothetical protein DYG99_06010 [Bacteroidetes bacterium CHB5]|nr:hypothetical protein [Bacteroidetes bacterium CHB5]
MPVSKKIQTIILLLALLLIGMDRVHAQVTVKEWFGVTSFLGGTKYGHGWPPENLLPASKIRRHYVALEYLSPVENIFWFNRSPIGWGWEESLRDYSNQHISNIITLVGGFPWQSMDGKIGSRMPIHKEANPNDSKSYYSLGRLCYNLAARWGNNKKAVINPNELANFSNRNHNWASDAVPLLKPGGETFTESGLGLVDYIEVLNEWDNTWSGSSVTFTPDSYAVCLKVCYDAIKAADPTMGILMGGLSRMDIHLIQQVIKAWEIRYGQFPDDIIINYHRYLHNGLSGGKRTKGTLPESRPFGILDQIHDMDTLGRDWVITEFGWDSDSTSLQRTPILFESDGKTKMSAEKSKGTLLVRSALLYATTDRCKMAVFYHIRNENNEGKGYLYASSGIFSRSGPSYNPTEAFWPVKEFLDKVGDCKLPATLVSAVSPYQVKFVKGSKKVIATWTDHGPVTYTEE